MARPRDPRVVRGDDDRSAPTSTTAAAAETLPSSPASEGRALPGDAAALPTIDPRTYAILGEHGRGGLGRILRARDERTGRIVAIEEMLTGTPAATARFVREALVTVNLQHPAITTAACGSGTRRPAARSRRRARPIRSSRWRSPRAGTRSSPWRWGRR